MAGGARGETSAVKFMAPGQVYTDCDNKKKQHGAEHECR